jgi:GNAT superfamily N-acetyltransferase
LASENGKVEFVWVRHNTLLLAHREVFDALWLHREVFKEQEKLLPPEMIDAGSTHAVYIVDPSMPLETERIGGSSIILGYDYLLIVVFWVHPSRRRKSLGRKLMNEIEVFAKTHLKRRVLLSTFEFQNALPFWMSCGFEEVGKINDYPEGQRLIYLHKRLSD